MQSWGEEDRIAKAWFKKKNLLRLRRLNMSSKKYSNI